VRITPLLRVTDTLTLSPIIRLDGPAPDGTINACLTSATGCPFGVGGTSGTASQGSFSTGFQSVQAVPEPSAILLVVTGLVALLIIRRKELSI